MKLYFILAGLIAIEAGVAQEKPECDGITINGVFHDSEILKEGLDRPYLLTVDYSTNNLYFSYNNKEGDQEFKSARLNLNTKEFSNIEGINNGFAQTIDQTNHDIYIGGSDGVYRYDYGTNKAEPYAVRGTNIWTLFFKDVLYFSDFPTQYLYTIIDGESNRFQDLEDTKVDFFVIDNENDIFFKNASGLFSQKKGTKDATLYNDESVMRCLTTDINGNVYTCLDNGIYAVRKSTTSVEKIFSLENGFGLAFDNDNNIIYSDNSKLVRLKANRQKQCKNTR